MFLIDDLITTQIVNRLTQNILFSYHFVLVNGSCIKFTSQIFEILLIESNIYTQNTDQIIGGQLHIFQKIKFLVGYLAVMHYNVFNDACIDLLKQIPIANVIVGGGCLSTQSCPT